MKSRTANRTKSPIPYVTAAAGCGPVYGIASFAMKAGNKATISNPPARKYILNFQRETLAV
jgi:hypothetical protein